MFITGGAGFIGSHIAEEYLLKDHQVTVYDNFSTGKMENLQFATKNNKLDIIEGDIRDYPLLEKAIAGHDIIFHQAAIASVQQSIDNPRATFEVNAGGTLNVLESARKHKVKKSFSRAQPPYSVIIPNCPKAKFHLSNPYLPMGLISISLRHISGYIANCTVFQL